MRGKCTTKYYKKRAGELALLFFQKYFKKIYKNTQKSLDKPKNACYNKLTNNEGGVKMTAKEIAEKSQKTIWQIYYMAKSLGRLPTVEEASNWICKTKGRPRKNFK